MARFKRWMSLLLSAAMVLTFLPVGVWASAEEGTPEPVHRYTVLVLDTSAGMDGEPMTAQKETALRFCEAVGNAAEQNEVAIVDMNTTAETVCGFTSDTEVLRTAIEAVTVRENADFSLALRTADSLLDTVPQTDGETTAANILFCSNGIAEAGESKQEGSYTDRDHAASFAFANQAVDIAQTIKEKGHEIYTLGFLHALTGNDLTFAHRLMKDLAVTDGYCEVVDPKDVDFVFGESCDVPEEPQKPQNMRATGCFYYPSFGGQDYTGTFYYDDDYFTKSAYEYQDSLATMTLCMALSAFGTSQAPNTPEGYVEKSKNLEYLLSECGFPQENYATNQAFREKPTMDSIGVGASHKTISDHGEAYTLIAAAVRGGGYESEWASNFTLGQRGEHQGFGEARDQVLAFLQDYIKQQNITGNIKLWITGYSRAAATTNMVAGALDGGYRLGDQVQLQGKDLYAYCYECPQGAARTDDVTNDIYKNIFNIVNPGDMVTKVAPTKPDRFGFQRFGVNRYLPTALKEGDHYNELKASMLEQYHALPSTKEYVVDDFQMKKISIDKLFWDPSGFFEEGIIVDNNDEKWDMNAFLDEALFKLFNENVRTRRNYVRYYEKDIRELCKALFGCGDKWDDFEDYFIENLGAQSDRISACLILHLDRQLRSIIEGALEDALHDAGITDYSAKQIKQFAVKIVALILPFGVANPNLTVTAVENLEIIGSAHLPEVCLAWLQSFDPNYTPEGRAAFNSGIHRVVHIKCQADVYVYDSNDQLVASIVNGTSQDIPDSSIVTYINAEDEKLVYLPADESYRVEVHPTSDNVLSYSVQEYSEEAGGVNRIVNYYDVDTTAGEAYTGYVPNVNRAELMSVRVDGSGMNYALEAPNGTQITADENLSGETAAQANCEVTVTSNNEAYGAVTGNNFVKVGGYAKLNAVSNEGCQFTGWYEKNDQLVSKETEYRFCVTEDTEIEGRFEPIAEETWTADFEWSKDYSSCTAVFTGKTDVQKVACKVTSETVPATATTDGKTVYTASAEFRGDIYTDQQTVVIPATGETTPEKPQKPHWIHSISSWFDHIWRSHRR